MNATLEKALTNAHTLSSENQSRLAGLINEFIEQMSIDTLEADLCDPQYRAYVEAELALSEQDLQDGNYAPLKEALAPLKSAFIAKHGL